LSQRSTGSGLQAIQNDIIVLMQEIDRLRLDHARTAEKAKNDQKQLLLDILDVMDSFERVFANIEPREQAAEHQARVWVGNFRSVQRVLKNHLKRYGVVSIEVPEGKATPGFHAIMETREQLDLEDGTILEELQKGYLWQGELLRKAHVIVVKN
jgi:molecular chaperone GrpE